MPLSVVCVRDLPSPRALPSLSAHSSVCILLCAAPHVGLMQEMVTITHNNRCAEMLATVRRGPFARSTQEERIEFLLTRMRKSDCKVAFADHALEHILSFQRRVQSIKEEFLRRGSSTPLGIPQDYWDRKKPSREEPSMRTSWYGYGNGSLMNTGKLYRRFLGL